MVPQNKKESKTRKKTNHPTFQKSILEHPIFFFFRVWCNAIKWPYIVFPNWVSRKRRGSVLRSFVPNRIPFVVASFFSRQKLFSGKKKSLFVSSPQVSCVFVRLFACTGWELDFLLRWKKSACFHFFRVWIVGHVHTTMSCGRARFVARCKGYYWL